MQRLVSTAIALLLSTRALVGCGETSIARSGDPDVRDGSFSSGGTRSTRDASSVATSGGDASGGNQSGGSPAGEGRASGGTTVSDGSIGSGGSTGGGGSSSACSPATCRAYAGLQCCGDACVLPSIDPRHCGGCDNACPASAPFCSDGLCAAAPCDSPDAGTCPPSSMCCGSDCCTAGQTCCLSGGVTGVIPRCFDPDSSGAVCPISGF
jgi:hypothetical protein